MHEILVTSSPPDGSGTRAPGIIAGRAGAAGEGCPDAAQQVVRRRRVARQYGAGALGPVELGTELGERATLVHFTSAFCRPCAATRRTLARVAGMVEGVRHVEVDAEENLSLVRDLDVASTPTVLVLDARGRVVRRAAGQPRTADVIAALGEALR
jgi:thiol-disulfide isomerase/thioredoxin